MSAAQRRVRPITGRFVLAAMLAFFGVVIAVNGVFIAFALRSFSGSSTEGAYQRGLDYNRELAAAATQKARGWLVSLEATPRPEGVALAVRFADRDGRPLEGEVRAELIRPAAKGHDVAVELARSKDDLHLGETALPFRGQWAIRVTARSGGQEHVLEDRLWLP